MSPMWNDNHRGWGLCPVHDARNSAAEIREHIYCIALDNHKRLRVYSKNVSR